VVVVVLRAKSNRLGDLKPLMPELLSKLDSAKQGTVIIVE
jgi:hypothetical protein